MTLSENFKQHPTPANVRVDCLHQLFELQVDSQPDNLAIVYQSQEISYGEVEARATAA